MKNKFFANKLYVINLPSGVSKIMRNKDDALEFCDDNLIDYKTNVLEFDSKTEYQRWLELKKMESSGIITDLRRQVPFEIIPAKSEKRIVGTKRKRRYSVKGLVFNLKSEAIDYCKENKLSSKEITMTEIDEQVIRNVVVEEKAMYTADFTYRLHNGEFVVEDVKSKYTVKENDYILRRKLMLHVHGIKIKEYIK